MNETDISIVKPLVIGADHRSSTMSVRDRLHMDEGALPGLADQLREADIREALYLSTDDRVEVLALHDDCESIAPDVARILADRAGLSETEAEEQLYVITDEKAIRHVFAEASALDGLIIGEPALRSALRASHRRAAELGMDGPALQRLLSAAYEAAEQVGRAAGFDQRPASIAGAAVRVARDLHGKLDGCPALLIGVGELGIQVADSLRRAGLKDLTVIHSNPQRAEDAATSLNCHVDDLDRLPSLLEKSDIVLTATNTRRYVIDEPAMLAAVKARRHRPVLLIDTGVPGDVDPAVDRLEDAFRYSLNDLEGVAREGRRQREAEAETGWSILEEAVNRYLRNAGTESATELEALRHQVESARQSAVVDAGGDADEATRLLVDRLLGRPEKSGGLLQRLFGKKDKQA